ncbi:histidine--tRNA ligase [Winogradskyella eximia]|uniref:histidine--tRNA ligase n=1 Tax=Winogradskyella eximia TaxID=262006 RepID=UPI00248F5E6E|nr:histidine--tRNA ligase [Winogradskyella eximia]
MAQKPSIPKGTRDFNAEEVAKRSYIMETIKAQFQIFGFQPIETPSFENSETLMGKYGDEGDRLIFKILNSGNFFYDKKNKIEIPTSIENLQSLSAEDVTTEQRIELNQFTSQISEKALRYDLTVPFARYVVQHQNDIEFPFKRYQMQPVWRADRPQKGRFREFYQCDADVVGSKSLFQEVEFVQLYDAVFSALKLEGVTIKINNRKILSGIAEVIGAQDKLIDFTVALDKLDKIGEEKVKEEMRGKGISEDGITKLQPLFTLKGDFGDQIESLKSILSTSEIGLKGIEELEFINTAISNLKLKTATLQLDVTLARGLNYYTGAIFEVSAPEGVKMGSIGGGGRYDDLTSIFGKPDTSGVGISFGLDRIYLVLEELNLFPSTIAESTKVLFINFGDKEALFSLGAVTKLRQANVKAELFPDAAVSGKQMKKQMNYANRRNIPFVVIMGEEELKSEVFTLKNMVSGEQQKLEFNALLNVLK